MFRTTLLRSVAPVLMLTLGEAAHAQTSAAPPPASPQVSSSAPNAGPTPGPTPITSPPVGTLGEIVVTAQRRSENLQRAAVSVDAVTGGDLVKNGITDSTTLANLVPGLSAPAAGGGNVFYFIRGVGNFTASPFAESAVAVNLDNVYLGLPIVSSVPYFDLERVEVLKGPQGTLYGRNATGGAVNIIPEKPQIGDFSGYETASYGNYNAYSAEGAVNLPIGDRSALRISSDFVGHDGYLSDGTYDENTKAGRVQFLSRITPQLTVRVSGDYTDLGGLGVGGTYAYHYSYNAVTGQYGTTPSNISRDTGLYSSQSQSYLTQYPAGPAGRLLNPLSPEPHLDNKLYGLTGQVDYDTSLGRLTLIGAWRPSVINALSTVSGILAGTREDDEQYSAELRFAGKRISIFDYTLGALYFHERQKGVFNGDLQPVDSFNTYSDFVDSYAGFGRVTAHLTDKLRLVGGIRYTVDDKSFDGSNESLAIVCQNIVRGVASCPTAPLFPFEQTAAGLPFAVPTANGGRPVALGTSGAIVTRSGFAQDTNLDSNRVTWRGALEYDLTPTSLLYGSVERGYRSGGFNLAVGFPTFKPEDIIAYTVGSKNRFLDNRLELNLETFVWNYNNQQVSHLGVDLAGNNVNITQNIGRSINEGAEVETRYLLTPDTALTTNIQYLDANYSSFSYLSPTTRGVPPFSGCRETAVAGTTLVDVNCAGKQAFASPKFTVNLGAQQTVRVGGYRIVANVDTQYLTSRYVGFDYQPGELAPPVWQTNGQLSLSPDVGRWTLSIFAENLEGVRYPLHATANTISNIVTYENSAPRTFGGRVSVKF